MTMSKNKTVSILTGFSRIFNCILNDKEQSEAIRELCIRALEDTSELIDIILPKSNEKVKLTPPDKPLPAIPGFYEQEDAQDVILNLMAERRKSLINQKPQILDPSKSIFKEKEEIKENLLEYTPDDYDNIRDMISSRKSNISNLDNIPKQKKDVDTKKIMAPTINKFSKLSTKELDKVTRKLFKDSTKFITEINPEVDVNSEEFTLLVNNEMDQRFKAWESE